MRQQRLVQVYTCQNVKLLEISCRGSFAIVYKGRHIKEMSVIDKPAHDAVGLQLLEMSSITTPNQTISNVCTRYIFHFKELF